MINRFLSRYRAVLGSCLALLPKGGRMRLGVVVAAQSASTLLDVIGVYLLALVAAVGMSYATGQPLPLLDRLPQGIADAAAGDSLVLLALVAAAALAAKSVVGFMLARYSLQFLADRQAEVALRLASDFFSQPLTSIRQFASTEIAFSLSWGVYAAIVTVLGQSIIIVSESVTLLILSLGLLAVDPGLAVATLVFFSVLGGLVNRGLSGWAARAGREVTKYEIAGNQAILNLSRTFRELRLSGELRPTIEAFGGIRRAASHAEASLNIAALFPRYVFEIALVLGALGMAAFQLTRTDLPTAVALLVLFLAAGSRIVPSLLRLQGAAVMSRAGMAQASGTLAIAKTLRLAPAHHPNDGPTVDPSDAPSRGEQRALPVKVDNLGVSFDPSGCGPGLEGLSFAVPAGATVGVIGRTGSGKSTLADAILGFRSLSSGSVLIGGQPPNQIVAAFPGALAYVPQDVVILPGTVRYNVTLNLGEEPSSDSRIWECLRICHLDGFLREDRDGLETELGESGVFLSGGQRQRLGMARALYSNPGLLVLDEATSALDIETEGAISDAVRRLKGNMTVVMIAHRLSSLEGCDFVIALDRGQLVGIGPLEELRRRLGWIDEPGSD